MLATINKHKRKRPSTPTTEKAKKRCTQGLEAIEAWKEPIGFCDATKEGETPVFAIWHWSADTSHEFSRVESVATTYEDAKRMIIDTCLEFIGESFLDCLDQDREKDRAIRDELVAKEMVNDKAGTLRFMIDPGDWAKKIDFIKTYLGAEFETDGARGNPVITTWTEWYYMISKVKLEAHYSSAYPPRRAAGEKKEE